MHTLYHFIPLAIEISSPVAVSPALRELVSGNYIDVGEEVSPATPLQPLNSERNVHNDSSLTQPGTRRENRPQIRSHYDSLRVLHHSTLV